MVTSSGYFVPPEPQAATPGEDLELMYESKDGPCQLLKGHKNDRIVVYKVLKPAFRDDPVYQRLLRREYEIGASLTHPGVCQTLGWTRLPEYGEAIEMEWIGGVRLDRWLQEHRSEKARQRRILMDICDALSYLHRKQVVHKDLKPENILVTRSGDYPKIIDFGLSDTDSILTGKEPGGTLLYAAPEVVAGGEADALSDIYSLGRIMQGMGPSFARVARKCTAVERERRYSSAEAVARDLRKIHVLRRATLVCILLLLFAGAVGSILSRHRTDPVEELWQEAVEQVRQAANPS